MIILIGLVILVAAVVVGMAGVLSNGGAAHTLTDQFAVFGYHVTGSTGLLFLYGIVVGAVGLFGLSLLLAGSHSASVTPPPTADVIAPTLSTSARKTCSTPNDDDATDERDPAPPPGTQIKYEQNERDRVAIIVALRIAPGSHRAGLAPVGLQASATRAPAVALLTIMPGRQFIR
jgi:hypothetical protein